MKPNNALRQLLQSNSSNVRLLKRYLLTAYLGKFQVNNLSPDNKFSLGDYLLDNERVVIDFTRLSEDHRKKFYKWFISPHKKDAKKSFLNNIETNDYRGFTAEVGLSWWGILKNFLFYQRKSWRWNFKARQLSFFNYQLNGMNVCRGENGLVIGLKQSQAPNGEHKYHDKKDIQQSLLRNTKRILLTDEVVEKLIKTPVNDVIFDDIINTPHPTSVAVTNPEKRFQYMKEYRHIQQFVELKPWYQRMWLWLNSWIKTQVIHPPHKKELPKKPKPFELFLEADDVRIYKRPGTEELLVVERRPDLTTMVFCGGGAKFAAHLGAYRAFYNAGIRAKKFAGTSSGAIMALFGYLGYTPDEILNLLPLLRQDILMHYDIGTNGISDTKALKAAIDYIVTLKVNEIIKEYGLEKDEDFLANHVFKDNKITFASLVALKEKCPDCGLGDELVVTVTNASSRSSEYYSCELTPEQEVSEAVKISGSFPIVYKPTITEGQVRKDGGILNNFPTDAFRDNHKTLLETEFGNNLEVVAFQFDNGTERSALDRLKDRVYRENFMWNWIYRVLTGVKDPVSGWERDRIKLRQYALQTVVIPVDGVSSTNFNVSEITNEKLIENGERASTEHIRARYLIDKSGKAINDELMHTTFQSVEALLCFCGYRGKKNLFELVAAKSEVDEVRINQLRTYYFPCDKSSLLQFKTKYNPLDMKLIKKFNSFFVSKQTLIKMKLFESIYSLFTKIPDSFFKHKLDQVAFRDAMHTLSNSNPFACLNHLRQIKGETHVLIYIMNQMIYKIDINNVDGFCADLNRIVNILESSIQVKGKQYLNDPNYYAQWELDSRQSERILKTFEDKNWQEVSFLCEHLKQGEEPLQNVLDFSSSAA